MFAHITTPEKRQLLILRLLSWGVVATGILTVASILFSHLHTVSGTVYAVDANITLIIGLSLMYLGTLLRRGKQAAWWVAVPLFILVLARNLLHVGGFYPGEWRNPWPILLDIILPAAVVYGLIHYRAYFTVRSEIRSATLALRRSALFLLVALVFGTVGFMMLDTRDFHQEIDVPLAVHYSIDQFGLTTNQVAQAYTRRGELFLDSLSVISIVAVLYVFISFFAPMRARISSDPEKDRERMRKLIEDHSDDSELFFSLWPQDKVYFYNHDRTAAIAYHVNRGVALAVIGPVGKKSGINDVIREFSEYCRTNDWLMAFVHTPRWSGPKIARYNLDMQKIGEEAVVDIEHFMNVTLRSKYFRQINNRFVKQGYSSELLSPPHHKDLLKRLGEVSDEWLDRPGRVERGFMMGYFNHDYMQQCRLMVVRDAAGTIQAFMNLLPLTLHGEADYDLLRYTSGSLGNINDFLLIETIKQLQQEGVTRLNMGLCPLAGVDEAAASNNLVASIFRFIYANGDRFYSFSGLQKFKSKYEPQWRSRYIVYQGGLSGITRTLNALMRTMRVKSGDHHS